MTLLPLPSMSGPEIAPAKPLLPQGAALTTESIEQLRTQIRENRNIDRRQLLQEIHSRAMDDVAEDVRPHLLDLRKDLEEAGRSTPERLAREAGGMAAQAAEGAVHYGARAANAAGAMTFRTWNHIRNADINPWMKYSGIGFAVAGLGYGAWRLTQWIQKPQPTMTRKFLKWTGLATVAAFLGRAAYGAVQERGKTLQESEETNIPPTGAPLPPEAESPAILSTVPSQQASASSTAGDENSSPRSVNTPVAVPETEPPPRTPSLLDSIPNDQELLGKPPINVTIGNRQHHLSVQTNGFYINNQCYVFVAEKAALGFDKKLTISTAKRQGDRLHLTMGALGQSGSTQVNSAELAGILGDLLQGRTFRKEIPSDPPGGRSRMIRLERA
jgi:hypothetical protein